MRFEVLGPIRLVVGGDEVAIRAGRERALLAMLLLHATNPVSADQLIDAVWTTAPPRDARNQLQGSVSRLRRQLTAAGITDQVIATDPAGYRAAVEPANLDLLEFRRRLAEARAAAGAGQLERASSTYREALSLWRGPALAGIENLPVRQAATTLDEERIQVWVECLNVELNAGGGAELVAELTGLVQQHPHRDGFHRALMLALYRAGRQADALAAYRHARQLLLEDLGIEPGRELQQLHQAILNRDPSLDAPAPARPSPAPPAVPRTLPTDIAGFTGRAHELRTLDKLLPEGGSPHPVVISAIAGTAGIGKTALAVHAGHQIAAHYPDGQLFIDLHGFTEAVAPVEPTDALGRLLQVLGVPGERIPAELDDRAGLWRSTLVGRRILIVLDNAASVDQVAPLVPGAPGCLVLVTSRRQLAGLDATHTVSLDMLPLADAVTLFARTAGQERLVDQSPELVAEAVELCGRLPLAIRIAATRLRSHPTWRVADLVERLRDLDQRLAELADEDGSRSVTTALDLSYQQLPVEQQRMYRVLGLHPGPDIDPYAAAAAADTTTPQARRLVDQLLGVHLLHERAPGRYVFHDLVRVHASHVAIRDEPEPARHAALSRLLDHFRYTASVAMDAAYPYERERRPRVPAQERPGPDLSDPSRAITWLEVELPNLLGAARLAAAGGWPAYTLDLSAILHRHLRTRSRFGDAETLHHRALETTRDTGNRTGELEALTGLGDIHRLQGRYEQATDHYQQALKIARDTGNRTGELEALTGLGDIHRLQGRYEQATDHYQQALKTPRTSGNRTGELDALRGLGDIHRLQGRYKQALDQFGQALEIARTSGNRGGELDVLRGLGWIHRMQGRYEQATDHYQQALAIARTSGNRTGELSALRGLGDIHRLQGRYKQATDQLGQALEIARVTGHRTGELSALLGLGDIHLRQGRHEQAADRYQQVLRIAQEINNRNGQFEAIQGLGRVHQATGEPDMALTHHHQALQLATDLQQPDDQARAHDGLAHAHHALHQHEPARQHWQHALDILSALGTDHTEDQEASAHTIRARLARLDQQPGPPVGLA